MPRRKKQQGRPSTIMPTIPDTFENILKAVIQSKEPSNGNSRTADDGIRDRVPHRTTTPGDEG